MVFWIDFKILVKAIAWIDIVISGLFALIIGTFTVIRVLAPEVLYAVVEEDPQEEDIRAFLEYESWIQAVVILLLLGFWFTILGLAILLLRWVEKGEAKGLWIWLIATAVISVVSLPFDAKWLWDSDFACGTVALFILGYVYAIFSLWAVWSLIQLVNARPGEFRQIVEFQAL